MGYYPPLTIIDALNETMLWHGTTVTLPGVPSIDWSIFDRWNDIWLEAFGGLYVTAERSEAWHAYAHRLAARINRRYEEPVVKPIIYQVILRPGVEIAIDEDEFGWATFLGTWEIRNLNASKVVSKCLLNQIGALGTFLEQRSQALQEDLKHLEELQKELDTEGGEPEVAVIEDPDFLYYQELVDTWSNEFAEPVLQGWMSEIEARRDWLELLSIDEMEARRGLPKLRILNGNFDLREEDI